MSVETIFFGLFSTSKALLRKAVFWMLIMSILPFIPIIVAVGDMDAVVTTNEAAATLNRQPQTLRKWATYENGPIQPIRIHGRLAWRVRDIRALLEVA